MSMTKRAGCGAGSGAGSGADIQMYGSEDADPDPRTKMSQIRLVPGTLTLRILCYDDGLMFEYSLGAVVKS